MCICEELGPKGNTQRTSDFGSVREPGKETKQSRQRQGGRSNRLHGVSGGSSTSTSSKGRAHRATFCIVSVRSPTAVCPAPVASAWVDFMWPMQAISFRYAPFLFELKKKRRNMTSGRDTPSCQRDKVDMRTKRRRAAGSCARPCLDGYERVGAWGWDHVYLKLHESIFYYYSSSSSQQGYTR